jgi:hypothetical protein
MKKIMQRGKEIRKIAVGVLASALIAMSALVFIAPLYTYAAPAPNTEEMITEDQSGAIAGGAFEVTSYDFVAKVNKDHSYEVEEKISVNIPKQLQSMKFSIPSGNFRISGLEVENAAYTAQKASEASTVSIMDTEKLSPGAHTYTIKYTIKEFDDRDKNKDIFYFDVLLPEWKQPIGKVAINVTFPEDFPWDDMQCYAGQFGVQDVNNRITFKDSEKNHSVNISGEKIPENFGITLKADLPDGYWKGALNGSWVIMAIVGIAAGVLALLAILWYIGGRDPKVKKTIETKPIEGVQPFELGYIFNGEVDIRDVLQLIMYFGQKGYLSISEYEPKKYRIIRKKDPSKEEKHLRNAYSILFEDIYKNRAIEMEDLGERLLRVRDAISDDVAAGHASPDSLPFTQLSYIFRMIGTVLATVGLGAINAVSYKFEYLSVNYIESAIVAFIAGAAIYFLCKAFDRKDSSSLDDNRLIEIVAIFVITAVSAYVGIGVMRRTGNIIAAVCPILLAMLGALIVLIMRRRGKDNAELVMRIRQLRNFIYHPTPKELLENHMADKNYYYDMLQYALAAGAEESWAISFLTLDVPEPKWYSDDIEGHAYSNLREQLTTVDYARDLKSFMRTIETAFADLLRRRRRGQ